MPGPLGQSDDAATPGNPEAPTQHAERQVCYTKLHCLLQLPALCFRTRRAQDGAGCRADPLSDLSADVVPHRRTHAQNKPLAISVQTLRLRCVRGRQCAARLRCGRGLRAGPVRRSVLLSTAPRQHTRRSRRARPTPRSAWGCEAEARPQPQPCDDSRPVRRAPCRGAAAPGHAVP